MSISETTDRPARRLVPHDSYGSWQAITIKYMPEEVAAIQAAADAAGISRGEAIRQFSRWGIEELKRQKIAL